MERIAARKDQESNQAKKPQVLTDNVWGAAHPNGFRVYLLIKLFGFRIRLHYWPTDVDRKTSPHDHRSWFLAMPLWGIFQEWRFRETKDTSMLIIRCDSTTGNGVPKTSPFGRGGLEPTAVFRRFPFIPYFCGRKEIHSFVPTGSGPALSIVLFGRPRQIPRVWLKPPGSFARFVFNKLMEKA